MLYGLGRVVAEHDLDRVADLGADRRPEQAGVLPARVLRLEPGERRVGVLTEERLLIGRADAIRPLLDEDVLVVVEGPAGDHVAPGGRVVPVDLVRGDVVRARRGRGRRLGPRRALPAVGRGPEHDQRSHQSQRRQHGGPGGCRHGATLLLVEWRRSSAGRRRPGARMTNLSSPRHRPSLFTVSPHKARLLRPCRASSSSTTNPGSPSSCPGR